MLLIDRYDESDIVVDDARPLALYGAGDANTGTTPYEPRSPLVGVLGVLA
jgi:hypothetical protein